MIKVGVDLMGNENSPEALLEVLKKAKLPPGMELVAFGLPEFEKIAGIPYIATREFISAEDSPLIALKQKKDSSLVIGLRYLKEKKIDVFISAGNTGALISGAKMILGNLPGILKPALLATMPTKKRPVAVLDVGAVVKAKAIHLVQFALLGAAHCKGIEQPIVGLLNIGSEPLKGTPELREAYQLLKNMKNPPFHFAGNIEAKSAFNGEIDVLVTDGFTGNVFLKTAEGIADFFRVLPNKTSGAILVGVQGTVIKCHGDVTPQGFISLVKELPLLYYGSKKKIAHE